MAKKFHYPGKAELRFERDSWGVLHILAPEEDSLYRGLGYAHALDRGLQLLLMRILGKGEGSRYLVSDQAMLQVDLFFRRMNWYGHFETELAKLSPLARRLCEAYCEGLNTRLKQSVPWELKLLGYKPEPWTPADCILLSRMTGYVSLSQSQAEVESLLLQMVQNKVPRAYLEELFGPLPELDEALLCQVKQAERLVPPEIRWNSILPKLIASNNWVIAGHKTASGRAILANDPHLEGNRLPNVWYEMVMQTPERYAIAATMPGLPGPLLGRTPDLAWGATYTFMDAVDSWVEEVKGGRYRRQQQSSAGLQEQWLEFKQRREVIQRKDKAAFEICFYENEHGTLQESPLEDGYYLATRWASSESGSESLNQIVALWSVADVQTGMDCLGRLETSWNWVLADSSGNIGYQMSGLMPRRRAGVSGLLPIPGWLPENDWQGLVSHRELPRSYNPDQGFFVTANQDLNAWGQVQPINMPMGAYRSERIGQVLAASDQLTIQDCQRLQLDRRSLQAERFMRHFKPLLPDTPKGRLLAEWNGLYEPDSQGAYLFEQVYRALLELVFGEQGLGAQVCLNLLDQTGIFADFYANFDRILLAEESLWFHGQPREALYTQALEQGLKTEAKPWGQHNQFVMKHLLFGGKLPPLAGFDRGPLTIPGGRATPQQGQIYQSGGRVTSFVPSIRLVTDFAAAGVHSCLLGGPSDRPFGKWYDSELNAWQQGQYKYLAPL